MRNHKWFIRKFPTFQYPHLVKHIKRPPSMHQWSSKPKAAERPLCSSVCWVFVKPLSWLFDFGHSHYVWLCHLRHHPHFTIYLKRLSVVLTTGNFSFVGNWQEIWKNLSRYIFNLGFICQTHSSSKRRNFSEFCQGSLRALSNICPMINTFLAVSEWVNKLSKITIYNSGKSFLWTLPYKAVMWDPGPLT